MLDDMQHRLDRTPEAGDDDETVEHTFGTLKAWMGSTHFLTKTLPRVRTEMSLQVLRQPEVGVKDLWNTAADCLHEGVGPLVAMGRSRFANHPPRRCGGVSRREPLVATRFHTPSVDYSPSFISLADVRRDVR